MPHSGANTRKPLRWRLAQKIELAWWKRYLHGKEPKAYLEWKRRYWQGVLDGLGEDWRPGANQRVLDAGCGPAGLFTILEGTETVAVDPLLDRYALELEHFDPEAYPWTSFVQAPLERYRPDRPFDLVYCMNAINHVEDIEQACGALCEALRPGGRLVVSIDAHNHGLFKHLFRAVPGDVLHPHQYDLGEYRELFRARGVEWRLELKLKHEFFFDHWVLAGVLE